jgi:hypothetical protein
MNAFNLIDTGLASFGRNGQEDSPSGCGCLVKSGDLERQHYLWCLVATSAEQSSDLTGSAETNLLNEGIDGTIVQ